MSLFSLLERTARRWPAAGAVFDGRTQVSTWQGLHTRALSLAGSLLRIAPHAGRVAIISENTPEYVEILFGAWAAGWAVVPVNYKLHPREMAQILEDADPQLVLVSASLASDLRSTEIASRFQIVVIGSPSYEELFSHSLAVPRVCEPDTLAWLFFTSGTTGRSKGAMLTHRNIMASVLAHMADIEAGEGDGSLVHLAPMSHGSGLYIPAYVACGCRQVVPTSRGFDPAEFVEICASHPACSAFLAPTMVQRLRQYVDQTGAPLTGLKTLVYGGGPMYVEDLKKSLLTFGQQLVQIYGQGESPMTITWLPKTSHASEDDVVLGSVGLPRTGVEVVIADDDGLALPAGQIGEVLVRGDVVMTGYWNNPAATEAALQNGWLHTGDVGSVDANGYLTLRDRKKDLVISGGSNIYPREVEEVLLEHPKVLEVSVIGEPDPEWGEVVIAFVVCTAGAHVTDEELDAHCLQRLARFKRPKRYIFVESLPKNSYGKVLKRALRESRH